MIKISIAFVFVYEFVVSALLLVFEVQSSQAYSQAFTYLSCNDCYQQIHEMV